MSTPGKDYIGVGVGIILTDTDNNILVMKRGETSRNEPGKWSVPGGTVEFGERLVETAEREVLEELGVTIHIDRLVSTFDHLIPAEQQHWVTTTFLAHITDGKPVIKEPKKCTEIRWCSLEELETMELAISLQTIVQYLKTHDTLAYARN